MIHLNRSLTLIHKHRLDLSEAFAGDSFCFVPDKALQILHDYLDYLENELSNQNITINISQVQEMLLEVSCIIRSGSFSIHSTVYGGMLRRLIDIYARGFTHREKDAVPEILDTENVG